MNITGMFRNNKIYLKAGTVEKSIVAKKGIYGWEYITPEGVEAKEVDIEGSIREKFIGIRTVIILTMVLRPRNDKVNTHFLMNDFNPSKNKQYREDFWSDYIDVVNDKSSGKYSLYQDTKSFSETTLTLIGKHKQSDSNVEERGTFDETFDNTFD